MLAFSGRCCADSVVGRLLAISGRFNTGMQTVCEVVVVYVEVVVKWVSVSVDW